MAKLILPKSDTTVIRNPEHSKKWHMLKPNSEQRGYCGKVVWRPLEYSTLDEIKAKDLCAECWQYEKE